MSGESDSMPRTDITGFQRMEKKHETHTWYEIVQIYLQEKERNTELKSLCYRLGCRHQLVYSVTATLEVIFVRIILAVQFLCQEYLSRFVFTLSRFLGLHHLNQVLGFK